FHSPEAPQAKLPESHSLLYNTKYGFHGCFSPPVEIFTLRGLQPAGHGFHGGEILPQRARIRSALIPARIVFTASGGQVRGQLAAGHLIKITFTIVAVVGDNIFRVP